MKTIHKFFLPIMTALALITISVSCGNLISSDIRPPAVAGKFYPSDPKKLKAAIEGYIHDSITVPLEKPIAIIVPHAGYIYAGQIFADAYRQVMERQYDLIVILGTNHTTSRQGGVSVGAYDAFHTPLGDISIDKEVVSALLAASKDCFLDRKAHLEEHSIEVQIPFIQILFPKAKIIPAIVNTSDLALYTRFGDALAKVLKNRRALIVISSDLSHYPSSENAAKADRLTLETIARLDPKEISAQMHILNLPNLDTQACGEAPILAGIVAAKSLGSTRATVVGYANSGDVGIGDRLRAVGYGAVVLTAGNVPSDTTSLNRPAGLSGANPLKDSEKKALLGFARESIHRYLTTQTVPLARNLPPRTFFPQGAFVTLKKHGQLRGCIGHIPPDDELGKTVGAMALQAAFNDPRFAPVNLSELKDLELEISVLSPMKPVRSADEIVVGRDGVVISKEGRSAVFLPQVAPENNWRLSEMLDNLCIKAGLPSQCWKHDAQFQVFQAEVFSENQFK